MIEALSGAASFVLAAAAILAAALLFAAFFKYKTQIKIKRKLREESTEHIKIIESGSNFRTRMSDLKKNMEGLKSALKERQEILKNRGDEANA